VSDEFPWAVPLADVAVDEDILEAVADAVLSGWWSMGPRVQEFESAFADFVGSRHAIAVANGTAALHLALMAADCGPDDEVVVTSLNFVAAANTINHVGATPVFCDVRSEDDLSLDPEDLEAALSGQTKAVVVMHYGGHPCDMDAIEDIARTHNLIIIEDAAHAPGARWRGRACGTIGDVGCYSFFSNKNLPVGEGGMVVTDDDAIAARIRLLRSHGMTTLTWDRHHGHAPSYDVVAHGFNYRLDEIRAAIGLVELERLDSANRLRAGHVESYRAALAGAPGITMPFADQPASAQSSHHLAVVLLQPGVDRERVRASLAEQRIQTSVHYPPIHRFSAYASETARALPVTDAVAPRLLTLPLYAHMTPAQVTTVTRELVRAVETAQAFV
jgi:dTDP-4-amino-4,6-dideoxygalactose transaminase